MAHTLEFEIDQNFDFFQRNISRFIDEYRGKFALLRSGDVVRFHDSIVAAESAGAQEFSDGIFSIQEVTDKPVDLGFFTHAFDHREA